MNRIQLLCIGDELMDGRTADANARKLGEAARRRGAVMEKVVFVADDPGAMADSLRAMVSDCPNVVTSGGLGPTGDDRTRAVIAEVLGVPLRRDPSALARVQEKYERRGRTLAEAGRRQADLPAGAELLESDVGTADGFLCRHAGGICVVLPGVPAEFAWLMDRRVEAMLAGEPRVWDRVAVWSLGEGDLAGIVESQAAPEEVRVTYCARPGLVLVEASAVPAARARLVEFGGRLRRALGPWLAPGPGEELGEVLVAGLRGRGLQLATAESCTGGLVASRVTDVPGASEVFRGGVTAYANRAKEALLGVGRATLEAHGAVSAQVAVAMATGARARLDADVAIALTGIAGPGGGTSEKPVGTVYVAVADAGGTVVAHCWFRDRSRSDFKALAAATAMHLCARVVAGEAGDASWEASSRWSGVVGVRGVPPGGVG